MDDYIEVYFRLGLSYIEIQAFLIVHHRTVLSLRTLKRRLARLGLYRRKHQSDILEVALFIQNHIQMPGFQSGYRWMHKKCLLQGNIVSRESVAALMSILDPDGVALRKIHRLRRRAYVANGPNFVWHVDSYDKLKRYGLCINGCIDGFSRFIIWVKVRTTTSNPKVVAGHFIEAVKNHGGCPLKVRGDMGTENGHIAQMQHFLTNHDSFIYGKSTGNQRIEMFWRHLRNWCCQIWIELIGSLVDEELFNGGLADVNIVQYVFMHILQVYFIYYICKSY